MSAAAAAVTVSNRSLFEPVPMPTPMRIEAPHRGSQTMRIWREAPAPREDVERGPIVECIEEDYERWDGLS